jgi:pimeloyl-ACP methyl ester carboxylesterase
MRPGSRAHPDGGSGTASLNNRFRTRASSEPEQLEERDTNTMTTRTAVRALKATALLGTAVLLATATTETPTAFAGDNSGGLAQFHQQEIDWQECEAPPVEEGMPKEWVEEWKAVWKSMQCGWMTVPKDYERPSGDKLKVRLTRIPSRNPGKRRGVLLLNPGGPGVQGAAMPGRHRNTPLAEAYDLIGMDPRGTSGPDRLLCDLPPGETPSHTRPTDAQIAERIAHAAAEEKGCERAGRGLRPYITTANTARDMDIARAVLGEQKINYLGYSYGTYLAAVYGSLFPDRLGRSVLDSSMHPDWSYYKASWKQSVGFRRNVDAWAAWVAERNKTYRLGSSAADVLAAIDELGRKLEENPLPDHTGAPVDRSELDRIMGYNSTDRRSWAVLAELVDHFREQVRSSGRVSRDASEAKRLLASRNDEILQGDGVFPAIVCERDWPSDVKVYERKMRQFRQKYPYGNGATEAGPSPCTFRSYTPLEQPVDVQRRGYPTGLVVQNDHDPATVYEGGRAMARKLGHRLVSVRDAGGHGVYGTNECVDQKVDDYLLTGRLPAPNSWCEGAPRPDVPADGTRADQGQGGASRQSLTSQVREILKQDTRPLAPTWSRRMR